MISVVIPTHDSERLLAHTLAALVPGALDGILREVIVADAGSSDGTAKVADVAGCRFIEMTGRRGAQLAAAATTARAPWLWFVQPGSIPGVNWIDELNRFIRDCELTSDAIEQAAVFRARNVRGRSPLVEALMMLGAAFSPPKPSQGLLITKSLYDRLGAHETTAAEPEAQLLRRLGRRRIIVLECSMAQAR
jgi:glycosyltransferase involved in cell wall biosynthesis